MIILFFSPNAEDSMVVVVNLLSHSGTPEEETDAQSDGGRQVVFPSPTSPGEMQQV